MSIKMCKMTENEYFFFIINILASFGGIFGLCLGGSVISLVEVFYFFTFKLYNNIRAQSDNSKSNKISTTANSSSSNINKKCLIKRKSKSNLFSRSIKSDNNNIAVTNAVNIFHNNKNKVIQVSVSDNLFASTYTKKYGNYID